MVESHYRADNCSTKNEFIEKAIRFYTGYLKKSLKEKVDAIVDELAKVPSVAKCYEAWNVLRDQVENYYKDKQREHLPLSRQKEFRSM